MFLIRIHKFGGSCLRDQKGLNRLTEILLSEDRPVIVTASAAYGVTQYLIDSLATPVSKLHIPSIIDKIKDTHLKLLNSTNNLLPDLDSELRKLERLLYGIVYTEEITQRARDLVLSFGERLMAIVIKSYFDRLNENSLILDPENIILTNGIFETSTVLLNETENKCQKFLETNDLLRTIIIVPGYYGASKDNIINLLGRSGTDYTATALAYGFNAESVIIWKDVLGFMTADPNIIPDAKTLDSLSYEEAAELSHFGAQILHSRSVIPAKIKNIPIYIKHIYNEKTQTIIWDRKSLRNGDIVKSVSYLENLAILRIYTTLGSNVDGVFNKISEKLLEVKTNIISIATSQTCISVLIDANQVDDSRNILHQLKPHIVDDIECDTDIALIGIVGLGLGDAPGIASRVFNSIATVNVNVEMISSGASKAAYHFTIKQNDLKEALRTIHKEFF
ncbi:MAG: aspartate kinase [Candidatus Kariarchaeaceae archaeon]